MSTDAVNPRKVSRQMALQGIDIPFSVLKNSDAFITQVHKGVPGIVLQQAIEVLGHRKQLLKILKEKPANLGHVYRNRLDKADSESVLSFIRLFSEAVGVFKSLERADDWLATALPAFGGRCPIELCDTFEGRALVTAALRKIELGDFS